MLNDNRSLSICQKKNGTTRRISSYDRTGGNKDYYTLLPGTSTEIFNVKGSGYIRHIWMTMATDGMEVAEEEFLPRKIVIRAYWDKEENPSIEAPIGDFFGMGHGITRNFTSEYLMMSPEDGKAFNCFFPMPFESEARIEITSDANNAIKFYFYVDYEECEIKTNDLRFHAHWSRLCPTDGVTDRDMDNAEFEFGGKNTTGEGNYVILDAEGEGHYVGCNFNVHNLRFTKEWNWYGEGDDMIFIDGEKWPPSLHGTGTEDYFNTAWCPQQEICTPYHGLIMGGGPNWGGKISTYRYHILDPIVFRKSIKVTIEHGHNNHRSDDISSTAYWYQAEPHKKQIPVPQVKDRLPLPDINSFNEKSFKKVFAHDNPGQLKV
ncbi:glycoside hydrolase family 172 protein [Ruminiclostridium cellobioparum]|uniref:glycoside hydrolase family 172 protein n=1 Tax=Ruminiclostridium cellobioparum TaxID=29355 RepID=UPI00048828CE|nr:glycoside hydrolase family 172 protein [Ruminiclostridium cellobioparum]